MSDENGSAPNCNGPRKLQLIRSAVIALAIISFIYFEIHSCSMDDDIASPEQPSFVSDNVICAASDVFFRDSEFGCVLGTLGTLITTFDGGGTWKGSTLDGGNLNDVHFSDRARGWVAGKDGSLYSTLDAGETWTRNEGQGYEADEDFFEVQFFSENVGYLLGYAGVYCTDDGGASWENNWLPSAADRGALDMSFVNERTGYLLGGRYLEADPIFLYRTANGGAAWEPVEGSRVSALRLVMTVWFVDERVGWAGGGVIMKTVDGGATWATQVPSATVREFYFFDSTLGFAVGGKTILRTENGGDTWANVTPPDDRIVDLRGICFLDAREGWVVGRGVDEVVDGRLIKRSLLLTTVDGGTSWRVREFLFDYTSFLSEADTAAD